MKIHFESNQNLGEKRFDAFSEQKVHYKMFKAGKRWLYAGIFMLSMGAGMVGLGGNVAQADTTTETDSTNTDQTVKTPADTGTYTLKSSETATTDQSTTAKETTDAASADQQSDTATVTNSNNTDSTQASTTTGDKSASTATSTTSSVKASTAVSSDNTAQTSNPKEAADATDDSASTNLTNNTAAAQSSSAAISSGDKTNVNASTAINSTLKTKPDTSQEETGTDAKTATLKATATSVTSDGQKLSTDKLTEATADTYATLQQMKTATAGMTQEELISYVTAHNNAAKAANVGTIFVVSDSGDIIPVTSKAGTYTADFTYKSTDGTELADSITKSTTLDNAASLLVEPPFIPGYQLDMDASKINVYSSVGEAQTISSYINTLNSIQSIPGYSLIAKPLNISSFQQLLDAIGAMLGVHLQDTNISFVTSLFGADSPTTSQTGHFDYVYKKTNSSIDTQPQTVSVGATVPTMSSFVKNAKDDAGNDVSTELTSPDYTNLSTATAGTKTFTLEYFNMKNLEFIQAQATLNVVNPVTTNVVTVNSQTIGYGTDKGIGSDYGFTVSQTGNDTQINVPTNLDSSDFSIQNASYSKSNHLNVGASPYTIAINPAGISKFSAANPDVVLDSTTNFASGKLTVTPAKLTITADNLSKNAGAQDPALTYTTDGLVDGDSVSATSHVLLEKMLVSTTKRLATIARTLTTMSLQFREHLRLQKRLRKVL